MLDEFRPACGPGKELGTGSGLSESWGISEGLVLDILSPEGCESLVEVVDEDVRDSSEEHGFLGTAVSDDQDIGIAGSDILGISHCESFPQVAPG